MRIQYSEINPLELKAKEKEKEITLMTYRLRVPDGVMRKGIVFFFSGFGSYCEHTAWMFTNLSNNGYEIIAMDYRGFGNSEGKRGYFRSENTLYRDCDLLFNKTVDKYSIDLNSTPFFLLGVSLGGMLSFNLAIKKPNYFKAIATIVPALRAPQKSLYVMSWLVKSITFIKPTLSLPPPDIEKDPLMKKYEYLFSDPKIELKARIQSIAQFIDMQDFAKKKAKKATTPLIMFTAGKDTLVCGKLVEKIFNKVNTPHKKLVKFPESDHVSIALEKEEVEEFMKQVVEFFDQILHQE